MKTYRNAAIATIVIIVSALVILGLEMYSDVPFAEMSMFVAFLHGASAVAVLISSGFMLAGFYRLGADTKNSMLSVASLLGFLVLVASAALVATGLVRPDVIVGPAGTNLFVGLIVLIGVYTMVFGFSLIPARRRLGGLASGAAALNIISGAAFSTVLLATPALLLSFAALFVEAALFFKAARIIK